MKIFALLTIIYCVWSTLVIITYDAQTTKFVTIKECDRPHNGKEQCIALGGIPIVQSMNSNELVRCDFIK